MVGSLSTRRNVAPRAVRASTIRSGSRETSTPVRRDGAWERAASIRWRLVNDLEPGNATVAAIGVLVKGAGHASPGAGVIATNTNLFHNVLQVAAVPSKIPCSRCQRCCSVGLEGNIYAPVVAVLAR